LRPQPTVSALLTTHSRLDPAKLCHPSPFKKHSQNA
jgi:hypothetical protein